MKPANYMLPIFINADERNNMVNVVPIWTLSID